MNNTEKFCGIIRQRSIENEHTILLLSRGKLNGQIMAVLRQELDSMIRVIFLLHQSITERERLIQLTLNGNKWVSANNKTNITDRVMVDLANTLNGWEESVYKFGCSFIHLSIFHDYILNDPFQNIEQKEIAILKSHLNNYHGFPLSKELTMDSVSPYLPMVFHKIKDNLEYYLGVLEKGGVL